MGHVGVSLSLFAPVGYWLISGGYTALAALVGATFVALAMLPDCDHRLPGLSHRGPTHSLLFAALVGGVFAFLGTQVEPVFAVAVPADLSMSAFGFLLGFGSVLAHLLADVITPMGVTFLWPHPHRSSLNVVTSKNPAWNVGLFVIGIVSAGWSLGLAFGLI